jgi:hypothetical protein
MASADFCEPFKIPYGIFSRYRQARRPPRVRTAAFPPHPPHLLHHNLMVMGFAFSRKLTLMIQPDMRFVFLRSAFCLRLPSDSTSQWTPLPLANSFHHQDLQGTFTPKLLPMPDAREAPRGKPRGIFSAAYSLRSLLRYMSMMLVIFLNKFTSHTVINCPRKYPSSHNSPAHSFLFNIGNARNRCLTDILLMIM